MLKLMNFWMMKLYAQQNSMKYEIQQVLANQRGAGAVEYALVLAVIVTMVVGAAFVMGGPLQSFFQDVVAAVRSMW